MRSSLSYILNDTTCEDINEPAWWIRFIVNMKWLNGEQTYVHRLPFQLDIIYECSQQLCHLFNVFKFVTTQIVARITYKHNTYHIYLFINSSRLLFNNKYYIKFDLLINLHSDLLAYAFIEVYSVFGRRIILSELRSMCSISNQFKQKT